MRSGGKTQLAIGFAGNKSAKPDFSNVSNEELARLEAMLLAIEARQAPADSTAAEQDQTLEESDK
jgi:hypothetical protein